MPTERCAEAVIETGVTWAGAGGDELRVVLGCAGRTIDGARWYTREALAAAAAAGLYDGAKMYLNHRDPVAEARRGHRDVREWVSTILPGSVTLAGDELRGRAHVHDPALRALLADDLARSQIGLSMDCTVRHERRAAPAGLPAQIIESIERVHSVDWVPSGNAGGRVAEAFAEGAGRADAEAELRARLRRQRGLTAAQVEALVAARPVGPPDEFTRRALRAGVRPEDVERLRSAR